jgi:hypothetical protein
LIEYLEIEKYKNRNLEGIEISLGGLDALSKIENFLKE